jgi:hypothetical protein
MADAPFNVVTRDDLDPVCPHCTQPLTEVYTKSKGPGWFLFPKTAMYFCPHCRKVLGFSQSRMA